MITLPTRIPDHSATCINHIFVKLPIQEKQTKFLSGIFYSDISDHLPCFIHIDLSKPKTQPRPFIKIEGHFQKFKHKLESVDWNEQFQPDIDWYQVFTPQPSGLEGYCRHGPGGRAAAKLAEPISL